MQKSTCKFVVKSDHKYAYEVDKHYHDCYEIVYYEKGHGTTIIDNKEYKFEPHSFALIQPHIIHSERANIDVVKLMFMGFEFKDENAILRSGVFKDDLAHSAIFNCLKRIFREINQKSFDYQNMVEALINQLVIDCTRIQNDGYEEGDNNSFKHVLAYLRYNAMQKINGKKLAEQIGYNYDYFRKMFKKNTGISVREFLLNEKMDQATALLKAKANSVNEIAEMTGFSSPSHFISLFKEKYGLTPTEYMKKYEIKGIKKDKADYRTHFKLKED